MSAGGARQVTRSLFAVLVVVALAAGCALPHGTRPVVKIGLVAPFEGRYRALGYKVLYAVKWAVRQRDASGGVAGYMVELVALNDNDDPDESASQAAEFAIDPDVMGVVGPFSPAAIAAAAPKYHAAGLAMVTPATCPPEVAAAGWGEVFCLGADVNALAHALEERIPAGSRVTLLRAGDAPLGERLRAAARLSYIASWDEASLSSFDRSPADVYLYDGDVLSAAELLLDMRARGIDAPLWGGPALARAQLPLIAGPAADGTCYAITAPLFADPSPGSDFAAAYRALAGHDPGPWAALAYDATYLLLDALERDILARGRPSRDGMIAALSGAVAPNGTPVFENGNRVAARVAFHCYGR